MNWVKEVSGSGYTSSIGKSVSKEIQVASARVLELPKINITAFYSTYTWMSVLEHQMI
jgi:hypothetical protein